MILKVQIFMKSMFKNKDREKNVEQNLKKSLYWYTTLATCCCIATALTVMVTRTQPLPQHDMFPLAFPSYSSKSADNKNLVNSDII